MFQFFQAIFLIFGLFFSNYSWAFAVELQASNYTSNRVVPKGSLSYEQNGKMHWQSPEPTKNRIINPKKQDVPLDDTLTGLTSYDLEYMDFYDTKNNLLANCLSTYYPIRENAILRFDLYATPKAKHPYQCRREVISMSN